MPIHACRGLPDPKSLFDPSGLSLCLPGNHFRTVPVNDMVLFHSMVSDGGLMSYTTLPCSGGSGVCCSCEGVHLFLVLLHPQSVFFCFVENSGDCTVPIFGLEWLFLEDVLIKMFI